MIIKYALRNIVRLPKQALIYAAIAVLVTASLITGAFVYTAAENAVRQLNEEYVFVASLTPISSPNVHGTSDITQYLKYSDFVKCFDTEICSAYNLAFSEGEAYLAGPANLYDFPTMTVSDDPEIIWEPLLDCAVETTANLALERLFFSKGARIVEGRSFSGDAYMSEANEIVVPKDTALEHNICVGDTITVCEKRSDNTVFLYFQCKVVGIYDADAGLYTPAYITAANFMHTYRAIGNKSDDNFELFRADFVLKEYDGFEKLVKQSWENGLDFSKYTFSMNNYTYDKTLAGLENIRNIVLITVFVISEVGIGLFIFFTAFFANGRKRELETLYMLGMKRMSIIACFTLELLLVLITAIPIGALMGRATADSVFEYVERETFSELGNVEEKKISFSEEHYATLDKSISISLSDKDGTSEENGIEIFTCSDRKEGYSRIILSECCKAVRIRVPEERLPVKIEPMQIKLLAVENIAQCDKFDLSVPYPEDETQKMYVYVPENFPYNTENISCTFDVGKLIGLRLSDSNPFRDYTLGESNIAFSLIVSGTYAPNDMCADHTLIIDYDRLQTRVGGLLGTADGYIETVSNGN